MDRALIIGDTSICPELRPGLLVEGLVTAVVPDIDGGLRQAQVRRYGVVVFIIGADVDAELVAVAKLWRETDSVIVALLPVADPALRASALRAGADDCLVVDADLDDVVATIVAKHERWRARHDPVESTDTGGGLVELDLPARDLALSGGPLHLTRTEALLMQALMRRAGRVVTRERLAKHVFGTVQPASQRGIDVQVSRLRKKLRALDDRDLDIATVPRVGYALRSRDSSTDNAPPSK